MSQFSYIERQNHLRALKSGAQNFDLIVIGGGINGAGVARDAALRGMRVLLIESNDYAGGTSSRSSKLVHGGIRYLENLEFHLVFEALNERQKLFALAPHLVHPLRFMIPLYAGGRVGMLKMGLGMWLYDALSLFQAPELHERLNSTQSHLRMPELQTKDLLGSYIYSDGYMDDDRLVHETLRSANVAGAWCLNYVRALKPIFDEKQKVRGLIIRDELSGQEMQVSSRHVISTVGAWTDELGGNFFSNWKKRLRPTKGVHLTFEKSRLPLSSAVVMAESSRIVFGIPRHEMVIVGTTDTDFSSDPREVKADRADVDYLLGVVDQYFPGAKLKEEDIVASYAGVRPLVQDGSASEGKTSREHTIETDQYDLTYVMGGKYTTYRLISEQAVEEVLRHFPIEDRVKFRISKSTEPLNPLVTEDSFVNLAQMQKEIMHDGQLTDLEAKWLVERHGPEALLMPEVWGGYWAREARHAIQQTMCLNLLDFYCRRVPLVLARRDHGRAELEKLGQVFQEQLGWTDAVTAAEKKKVLDYLDHEFQWRRN